MTILALLLGVAILVAGCFLWLNRPVLITFDARVPESFPSDSFDHSAFERLMHRYVDHRGNVDYDRWQRSRADLDTLDGYLAAVARFSPESAPERFPRRSDALAYWLYAYNAYVVRSVLQHWPIDSVTDVRAPIEAVTGLGFFYRQRFLFGGETLSLYAVEHDRILESFRDPRVHFVLNCASQSCPPARPALPTGDELESLLQSAAIDFINDPRNVAVVPRSEQIRLSTIFRWYRSDFLNDLRRRGVSAERGVIDYIARYADRGLADELIAAKDFDIVFEDYDWALNRSTSPAH